MTESEFTRLVNAHDLGYAYSDDHSVWERGRAQYAAIVEAAKSVSSAAEIWNANVDRKMRAGCREEYYWTVPSASVVVCPRTNTACNRCSQGRCFLEWIEPNGPQVAEALAEGAD